MEEFIKNEYGDYLTTKEMQFALDFYAYTKNKTQTIVICNELKQAFYGKTFGKVSKVSVAHINEELAKGVCLALIDKDDDFYNKLPVDLQDDMIGLYERVLDEDELKNRLCELLDIKAVNKQELTQHEVAVKEYKVNENDHSLLGRLRKFQKELNEENK